MVYWGVVVLLRTGAEPRACSRSVAYWGGAAPLRTGAETLRCVLGRTRGVLGQTCDHSSTFATVDSKGVER